MSKHYPKNSVLCPSVRPLLMLALLASLVVALPSPRATADVGITAGTTIRVDITTDTVLANDGHCSLREAIIAANSNMASGGAAGECPAGSGNDTVVLDSDTYNMTLGALGIGSNIAIQGAGSDATIIDGSNNDRVFYIASGSVDISRLAIRNGNIAGNGGGIYNDGVLALTNCVLHDNTASGMGGSGGGIYSNGPTTLTGSTLRDNEAGAYGGGYYGVNLLTVADSTIHDNTASGLSGRGGGIYGQGMATLTLTNSSVNGNTAIGILAGSGGGIRAAGIGMLTLTNSSVNGNTASGGLSGSGGGVYTEMGLNMTDSHVDNNTTAGSGGDGGGIWAENAGVPNHFKNVTISGNTASSNGGGMWSKAGFTMENSTVSGNEAKDGHGGGVYASGAGPGWVVELKGVTVNNNKTTGAGGDGGGVYCTGALAIEDSTVSSNVASGRGGGILGSSTLTVEDSTIKDNTSGSGGGVGYGGGIACFASLSVNGSTISGNKAGGLAADGGGIFGTGNWALTNSTLSGNRADRNGGGMYQGFGVSGTLNNVTIADNTADYDVSGGIDNGGGFYQLGTLIVKNSLIADNKRSTSDNDCYRAAGTLTSQGYNLVENADGTCAYDAVLCVTCFGQPGSNDVTGQDPKLAALADNGGPNWTQALQSGSPALDRIPNGTNGCGTSPLDVDQRGFARPRPTGDSCDTGAYETQSGLIYLPAVLRQ